MTAPLARDVAKSCQPFLFGEGWIEVKDGNDTARAWRRWSGERLFTYVDPANVPPTIRAGRPTWGHCFYQDGYRFAGLTRHRLHILERLPDRSDASPPRRPYPCGTIQP